MQRSTIQDSILCSCIKVLLQGNSMNMQPLNVSLPRTQIDGLFSGEAASCPFVNKYGLFTISLIVIVRNKRMNPYLSICLMYMIKGLLHMIHTKHYGIWLSVVMLQSLMRFILIFMVTMHYYAVLSVLHVLYRFASIRLSQ